MKMKLGSLKQVHNLFLSLAIVSGFCFVAPLKAVEQQERNQHSNGKYVTQMLVLFKASELMDEEWIDYIRDRAAIYREVVEQLDRYPLLGNLEFLGNAQDYAYDFLAMQAVRCERYSELLSSREDSKNEPELEFQLRAFENCVSILYTKIREALVDLKLKSIDRQQ